MTKYFRPSDIFAGACYCKHEELWKTLPHTLETAKRIDKEILLCTLAQSGFNLGCAHLYLHAFQSDKFLFSQVPVDHPDKQRLKDKFENLHKLKNYLDQLTRQGYGSYLTGMPDPSMANVGGAPYRDDTRLYAAVLELPTHDMLRTIFEQVKKMLKKGQGNNPTYTLLLHHIDDLIIVRMNEFLDEVRAIIPDREHPMPETSPPVLTLISEDYL